MNMKNKGFTLVELIVTVALLAIISVVIGVSMSGMLSRQDDKELKNYQKEIEKAACAYAEANNFKINENRSIDINTLISSGTLKKTINNPKSGKPITDYGTDEVKITWDNGEKTCSYEMMD